MQRLRYRLEKEMETKDMISDNQAEFRRRRWIIFSYLIEGKESGRRQKKSTIYMLFANLKVAFDKVDRDKL